VGCYGECGTVLPLLLRSCFISSFQFNNSMFARCYRPKTARARLITLISYAEVECLLDGNSSPTDSVADSTHNYLLSSLSCLGCILDA